MIIIKKTKTHHMHFKKNKMDAVTACTALYFLNSCHTSAQFIV